MLHFEKGENGELRMESFTAQIDFPQWHNCYALAWIIRLQVSLFQRKGTFSYLSKRSFGICNGSLFTKYLVSKCFLKVCILGGLSPHFYLWSKTRMSLNARYHIGFSCQFSTYFHNYTLPFGRNGQLWWQKINFALLFLCLFFSFFSFFLWDIGYILDVPS